MFLQTTQKFILESSLLATDSTNSINISSSIKKIKIKEDFIEESFPLVILELCCTEEVKDFINENENLKVFLRVFRYTYDSTINQEYETDSSSISTDEVVFSTFLKVFKKPYSSSSTNAVVTGDTSYETTQKMNIPMFNYTLATIPINQINTNYIVNNQVYKNILPAEAAVNLLSQSSIKEIFLAEPDNKVKEPEIIVPPMNLVPALRMIQNNYGIFNYGLNVYFDLNENCYLYSPLKPKSVFNNSFDITITSVINETNKNKFKSAFINTENNDIRLSLEATPPFISYKEINNDFVGLTTIFNSYDSNFDLVSRINKEGEGKKRYFWNSFNNQFFENSFLNEVKKNSKLTTIPINNIDPNYFLPSTRISVNDDINEFINGEYCIKEKFTEFSTTDYSYYESYIFLKLIKIS